MTLEQRKIELMELLLNTQKESVLDRIQEVYQSEPDYNVNVKLYNQELDTADLEIKNGDFLSNEDAKKEISSWRSK